MRILPRLTTITLATLLLTGSALADDKKMGANSGFLGEAAYSKMQEVKSPSGVPVKRWIAPGVSVGQYEAIVLDKSVFYPAPQPTDQLSMITLNRISDYLDEALRRELGGVIRLASEPGPKTLRLRPAITAAAALNEGLKAYQLIPVAFVLTRGQTTKKAALAVEYEFIDTESGNVVAAGMRLGEGAELKSMKDTLTLEQMKPAIDAWAKDARTFFATKAGK
jgi:hypothetical protein